MNQEPMETGAAQKPAEADMSMMNASPNPSIPADNGVMSSPEMPASRGGSSVMRLIYLLLLLIALSVIGASLWVFFVGPINLTQQQPKDPVSDIIGSMRNGEFETALGISDSIRNSPEATAEEKAQATFLSIGARYWVTGDSASRLEDIRMMKDIVRDESLSLDIRVNALNLIAAQYSISGADADIYEEIYKDAPFSQYRSDDPNMDRAARLAGRNLFEWSMSMKPTSMAAIHIARWYSEQAVFATSTDSVSNTDNSQKAEQYLRSADALAMNEVSADPRLVNTPQYLLYKYWRSVIIGRLAASPMVGAGYKDLYRSTYDEFIQFADAQPSPIADEYILYARLFYAGALARDADPGARAQLDLLAEGINAADSKSVFKLFLKNEYELRPTGATWVNLVQRQFVRSSEFKAAVEAVVGKKL